MTEKGNPAYRFVLTVAIGYFAFQVADILFFKYEFTRTYWALIYHAVLQSVIYPVYWLLKGLGYEVYKTYDILWVVGTKGVKIDRVCTGVDLMANLAILISAYPGRINTKLLVIPLGVFLIICLNIARVFGVAYCQAINSSLFSFDYHYAFNFLVYVIIFFMWVLYVNLNSKVAKKDKKI